MPLDVSKLAGELASTFAAPASDTGGCGQQWADAMKLYAADLVPPSTKLEDAATALAGALAGAFASPSAIAPMETAFAAFGATLALGQAPLFTGTPPGVPVGFVAQFAGPAPATHGAAASAIAARIHAWMQTGTVTLVAPPNTVTPWA
jgi:hypothetical protein